MVTTGTTLTEAMYPILGRIWDTYRIFWWAPSTRRRARAAARLERRYKLPPLSYTIHRLDLAIDRCREALR